MNNILNFILRYVAIVANILLYLFCVLMVAISVMYVLFIIVLFINPLSWIFAVFVDDWSEVIASVPLLLLIFALQLVSVLLGYRALKKISKIRQKLRLYQFVYSKKMYEVGLYAVILTSIILFTEQHSLLLQSSDPTEHSLSELVIGSILFYGILLVPQILYARRLSKISKHN